MVFQVGNTLGQKFVNQGKLRAVACAQCGNTFTTISIAAVKRDEYRCRNCKASDTKLHAHHMNPLAEGGEPYSLANIVTLCADCHIRHHRRGMELAV